MQTRMLDTCKKGSLNGWPTGVCRYTRVHSSVPVSKGTALGKGTPPTPLFTGVWQKPGAPILDAVGSGRKKLAVLCSQGLH